VRLLVVEDEVKTAAFIRRGLEENGYVVDVARNGEDGLALAVGDGYDLVILDVMLPKMDGWTVLSRLRSDAVSVPVLMLTARDAVEDRVRGLELGADDYLVKPFAFSELLARTRAILRRGRAVEPEVLEVGDLRVMVSRHRALRAGEVLELTPKEFLLLALLARREGEVLSRTLIAEQIWDVNFDCDSNVVDAAICRLRAKVDDPFPAKLIHTVRGVGYVLEER
jgi:two-component system copper resistance phosphate regulon response regulator CusR